MPPLIPPYPVRRRRRLLGLGVAVALCLAQAGTAAAADYTPVGVADWDRDGRQDMIVRDIAGDLWKFAGGRDSQNRAILAGSPARISREWHAFTMFGVTDWDRDGNADILARNDVTGDLSVFRGPAPSVDSPELLRSGMNDFLPVGVADWDRNGTTDIIMRKKSTGALLWWEGNNAPGPNGRAAVTPLTKYEHQLFRGWEGYAGSDVTDRYTAFGVADWNNDGRPDIVARDDATNNLWWFEGTGNDTELRGRSGQIDTAWGNYTPSGVADFDGDGQQDILVRDDPRLELFRGSNRRVATVSTTLANDWGSPNPTIVALGDSAISGEAGRWAGNVNGYHQVGVNPAVPNSLQVDALGREAYGDQSNGQLETIPGCHRSKAAEIHIGDGLTSVNLACASSKVDTYRDQNPLTPGFKPGLNFADPDGPSQLDLLKEYARTHREKIKAVVVLTGSNIYGFGEVGEACVMASLGGQACKSDSKMAKFSDPGFIARATAEVAAAYQNVRQTMERDLGYRSSDYRIIAQTYSSPVPRSGGFRQFPVVPFVNNIAVDRQLGGGCGVTDANADWVNNTVLPIFNKTITDAIALAQTAGVTNIDLFDMTNAFVGRRLCEQGVDLVDPSRSWTETGAVDRSEWVLQARVATAALQKFGITYPGATGEYSYQENAHPSYWGQLALRNCLRQAINGGNTRGGTCSPATGLNSSSEPNMDFMSDDPDDDDVPARLDNCRQVANHDQADRDRDGTGDACDDLDADGVLDATDNCWAHPNRGQDDFDRDGNGDVCDDDDDGDGYCEITGGYRTTPACGTEYDNCAGLANPEQEDSDGDLAGDACDGCPNDVDTGRDMDRDDIDSACDKDDDGDGVNDDTDNCPDTPNLDQLDLNGNGVGTACDASERLQIDREPYVLQSVDQLFRDRYRLIELPISLEPAGCEPICRGQINVATAFLASLRLLDDRGIAIAQSVPGRTHQLRFKGVELGSSYSLEIKAEGLPRPGEREPAVRIESVLTGKFPGDSRLDG